MEESLYDEFGNYIGPELKISDEEASNAESEIDSEPEQNDDKTDQPHKQVSTVLIYNLTMMSICNLIVLK
jgi:hypothetical protein